MKKQLQQVVFKQCSDDERNKQYIKPELKCYGKIKSVTLGATIGGEESSGGGNIPFDPRGFP